MALVAVCGNFSATSGRGSPFHSLEGKMPKVSESLSKWEAIEGIRFDFITAEIHYDFPTLHVRLVDGRVNVEVHEDLVFRFEQVDAFTMHEEFVHPTQGTVWGKEPIISAECPGTYPCLIVAGSEWFECLRDELEIHHKGAIHYRLCTDYPVIDIASPTPPTVSWYRRSRTAQDAVIPIWSPK